MSQGEESELQIPNWWKTWDWFYIE